MAEYAKLAIDKVQAAMAFIVDYFQPNRADFVLRYFAGRKDVLDMATTEAAHPQDPHRPGQPRPAGHRGRPGEGATAWCWPAPVRARRGSSLHRVAAAARASGAA